MNQKFIVIDGKTYKSVDEMPEDVRREYESAMRNFDQNQNGMPDAFEGMASFQGATANVINTTKIIVNGQTYDSVDQLPPDIRAKYEQALGAMDANKNGIPDFVEGMMGVGNRTNNIATNFVTPSPPLSKPIPVSQTIEAESSNGWMLALAGILMLGLCIVGAAGVWYFYLR